MRSPNVVSDYKDTNFWKQFTTKLLGDEKYLGCFRLQRYKLLKAIHNKSSTSVSAPLVVSDYKDTNFWKQFTTPLRKWYGKPMLFQTTKIQTFESNSQLCSTRSLRRLRCFRLQRYKLLKAIHNQTSWNLGKDFVVSDYKDTNFWKQFTTTYADAIAAIGCFRLQRYKLLKAIHNCFISDETCFAVVSDYKDTNFWKQFTTKI